MKMPKQEINKWEWDAKQRRNQTNNEIKVLLAKLKKKVS